MLIGSRVGEPLCFRRQKKMGERANHCWGRVKAKKTLASEVDMEGISSKTQKALNRVLYMNVYF